MTLYVRLINKSRWANLESPSELSGESITEDWYCKGNEWSVFQFDGSIDKLDKDDLLDKIVLRMVADNIKKTQDGVDLLVLDAGFFRTVNSQVVPDKTPKLHSYHCNICDVTYGKIQRAVEYTCRYLTDRVISYSMKDIKDLIENSSSDFLTEYKRYANKKDAKGKRGERLNRINKAFNVKL